MAYRYRASVHSPFESEGRRYVKIRVIDTSPSGPARPRGERWRVTYQALRKALPTVLKAPLVGPPELGHRATKILGRPVEFQMPDGHVDVIYEITDDEAWRMIKAGRWRDVSPQVSSLAQRMEAGVAVLDDFRFDHVAFVERGAFPEAEVLDICEGGSECVYRLAGELTPNAEHDLLKRNLVERVIKHKVECGAARPQDSAKEADRYMRFSAEALLMFDEMWEQAVRMLRRRTALHGSFYR